MPVLSSVIHISSRFMLLLSMTMAAYLIALWPVASYGYGYAHAQDYAIVVNVKNPATGNISYREIKNIYLKIKTTWPDGTQASPFGRPDDDPAQQAFIEHVLDLSQHELDQHWASEKSKTGGTGPREVGSDNILLRQIARKPGGIGVVSVDAKLPPGVKILFRF